MRILILLVVLGVASLLVKQQLQVKTPPVTADHPMAPVAYGNELEKARAIEGFMQEQAELRLKQADELSP